MRGTSGVCGGVCLGRSVVDCLIGIASDSVAGSLLSRKQKKGKGPEKLQSKVKESMIMLIRLF